MADYQETARQKLKDLSSKNPATRRAAAYYLGEAGVDEAITKLATVYKSDPDPSVRKAAAYSLGMFRAVEQALKRGEQDRVLALLHRVVDEGRLGGRQVISPTALVRIEIGLVLLLVLVIALHLLLPNLRPLPGGIELPTVALPAANNAPNEESILALTRATHTSLLIDLNTLQSQFQRVLNGGTPDCTAFYNLPTPIEMGVVAGMSETTRQLVSAVNAGQVVVMNAHARLGRACFENEPVNAAEVGGLLAPVVTALRALSEITPLLNAPAAVPLATEAPSATPSPTPTDTPPTETPPPTEIAATATPEVSIQPREHLTALYDIIDSVSGPRNAAGRLRQAWTDTANAGTTRACSEPPPAIPSDYVLPPGDASALPEVAQATEQVNLALALLRQGWDLFRSACASNTLAVNAATGLQTASTAEDALRIADGLLQALRSRL